MKTQMYLVIGSMLLTSALFAQKGVGDQGGLARNNADVSFVELSGQISKIETGPCKNTTGRSVNGTHMYIVDGEEEYNIHLGPADEIEGLCGNLKSGDEVQVVAFQTDKLPANQYIAKSFTRGDEQYVLRNDRLRPFWAVGRGNNGRGRNK